MTTPGRPLVRWSSDIIAAPLLGGLLGPACAPRGLQRLSTGPVHSPRPPSAAFLAPCAPSPLQQGPPPAYTPLFSPLEHPMLAAMTATAENSLPRQC